MLRGDAEPPFEQAIAALRDNGEPFWVATALLEEAEYLAAQGRAEETASQVRRRARSSSACGRAGARAARRARRGRGVGARVGRRAA